MVEQFYLKPGSGKVVSKNQFFYDSYHPTSVGHTVMADGILHLLQMVDGQEADADTLELEKIVPPIGGAFEKVRLLDRRHPHEEEPGSGPSGDGNTVWDQWNLETDCGGFCHVDTELQAVERNLDLGVTPEFPDNWMYRGAEGGRPFAMEITCESLLLVYKDSASNQVGCAEVWVDGEKVLFVDPHVNGWTHCNALICFKSGERKRRHVEVRLAPGMEDKDFTILGFGVV